MASIPPVNGPQPNSSSSSSSSSVCSSTKKVSDVALEALAPHSEAAAAVASSRDCERSPKLEELQQRFKKIIPNYQPSESDGLVQQLAEFQTHVMNYLADQILQKPVPESTTVSRDNKSLESVVSNSIKIWKAHSEEPPADEAVATCFADNRVGELMHALCSSHGQYYELRNVSQIIIETLSLVEDIKPQSSRTTSDVNTPKSSTGTPSGGRRSSEDSVESSNSQLASVANAYRSSYESLAQNPGNGRVASGNANKANEAMISLLGQTNVVVLGKGSHQEYALDSMIIDPQLPHALAQTGVKTVVAEHIYPEHVSKLKELDCSEVAKHLTNTAFGSPGKAFNYLQFLRACTAAGIEVIAADTKEIYRPSGVKKLTYESTDRLEALNANIVKLHEAHKEKGKMLIILGAAHSNHLNASAARSLMISDAPKYRTPGVTDVISDSEELIVVTKKSNEEMFQRMLLQSIRNGMVFQVEV